MSTPAWDNFIFDGDPACESVETANPPRVPGSPSIYVALQLQWVKGWAATCFVAAAMRSLRAQRPFAGAPLPQLLAPSELAPRLPGQNLAGAVLAAPLPPENEVLNDPLPPLLHYLPYPCSLAARAKLKRGTSGGVL